MALLAASPGHPAHAATFAVTKTADTADGACDGDCSLREAIIAANSLTGADIINVPAGTYTLTIAGAGEDAAATGDLDITDDLDITGSGAATTIIDGNGGVVGERVFFVDALQTGITVDISGVTIRNASGGPGGGIVNLGTLTLTDIIISGNSSNLGGGGIYTWMHTLTLNNVTVSGNSAATGGGIFSEGTVILNNSTVSGNTATAGNGGGISSAFYTLELTDSTVSGNSATGDGGGIGSAGTLRLTDSTVSGNTATLDGGGIANRFVSPVPLSGTVTLDNSTVSDNTSTSHGGGISNLDGTVTLTDSTVSGNTATLDGGGIANSGTGTLTLTNATISGNTAKYGGGVLNGLFAAATLTNVTVSGNTAIVTGTGGGIFNGTAATLKNTIVANNSAPTGADCWGFMTSDGHNLIEDPTSCIITGDTTGNITGQDPDLGPLSDNGGPTLTHSLNPGGPAIDAGSGDCPPPAADQRGVTRPLDGDGNGSLACDVGAFEACSATWAVPLGDGDCDGFTDADEGVIGTDPADPCANTPAANDEADDRWPSDFDDNQVVNILDVNQVLPPTFGTTVPPTSPRHDIVPDGFINILDVNMTLPPYFGAACSAPPAPTPTPTPTPTPAPMEILLFEAQRNCPEESVTVISFVTGDPNGTVEIWRFGDPFSLRIYGSGAPGEGVGEWVVVTDYPGNVLVSYYITAKNSADVEAERVWAQAQPCIY